MIEIREVISKRMMRDFVQFPLDLYKNEPKFIPSFFGDEMKLFDAKKNVHARYSKTKFFLCYKDGVLAGRIAGIIVYPYLEKVSRKILRFSRVDFIDDFAVSEALFKAVENFAKEEGLNEIHGPLGYNDLDREGLLIEGFEYASTFAAAYTYDYFPKHIERLGYGKEVDWVEFMITLPEKPTERHTRIANMVEKRFKLREAVDSKMTVKKIVNTYGKKIFELLNESYGHLHGTVPFTPEIVDDVIKQFKIILIPDFISIIVNENDDLIGFGLILSSLTDELVRSRGKMSIGSALRILKLKNHPVNAELGLIGVTADYRNKGVNAMIINKLFEGLLKHNIKQIETNLELETNDSIIGMWDGIDKKFIKRRRCYIKPLDGTPVGTGE